MSSPDSDLPAVTVLMPVYNGARFLREQVGSILGQQHVTLRLVILDDGSTDASFALATDLAAQDARITLAERRPNAGLTAAVARLLGFVETPYFAMSDQDDIWDPDKLHRSIVALNESGAKLVYSDVRIIDGDGTVIENSYWASRSIRPVSGTDLLPVVFQNPIIGHTIVASADVATSVTQCPRGLVFYEVWIAAAATRLGSIGYVDAQLGSYRIHSSNVVGPMERRFYARVFRRLVEPKRFRTRQQQRVAGMAAISEGRSEYKVLADLYAQGLAGRIRSLPRFLQELRARRPALGCAIISKETLMHLVIGPGNVGSNSG